MLLVVGTDGKNSNHGGIEFPNTFLLELATMMEDDARAVHWYRKAAEQGHPLAQYNLGFMYDRGEEIPEDDAMAVRWYREAAGQGYAGAQYNLGFVYDRGEGVPEDDAWAVHWFRKVAEQGFAGAQYILGVMYARGEGIPEDLVQAYAWFSVAAAQGHDDAQKVKERIAKEMTSAGISDAQKLSREYREAYVSNVGE